VKKIGSMLVLVVIAAVVMIFLLEAHPTLAALPPTPSSRVTGKIFP